MTPNYEVLFSLDRSSGFYEFDEFRIVRDFETNLIYYTTDLGCSCPSPFEEADRDFPKSWTPIRKGDSFIAFARSLKEWVRGRDMENRITSEEVWSVIDGVKTELNAKKPEPLTDRQRLNWLILRGVSVQHHKDDYWIKDSLAGSRPSARMAIDAAIHAERRARKVKAVK